MHATIQFDIMSSTDLIDLGVESNDAVEVQEIQETQEAQEVV